MYKSILFTFLLCATLLATVESGSAQTTAFNFQGRLNDGSIPANGRYDLQFKLFDAIAGGVQVGATADRLNTTLINGVFSTTLDFGAAAFTTGNRFIEISVRPNGSPNAHVILGARQQILSVPFAVRAQNAATLEGQAANDFVKNGTALQTASFNISGNGYIGGNFGINTSTPQSRLSVRTGTFDPYGVTHTNGTVTVSTFVDNSGGAFGTRTNNPLYFFTNDSGPQLTIQQNGKVDIGGAVSIGGSLGVGTVTPNTRLTLSGGPQWTSNLWTASMNMQNGSALGWEANSTGQRFGIGQTNNGLQIFRTISAFGSTLTPAETDVQITNNGDITQPLERNGLVKAMALIEYNGSQIPTIVSRYNGITGASSGDCGFIYGPIVGGPFHRNTRINFGFQVNNRFISTTPYGTGLAGIVDFVNATTIQIYSNFGNFYIFVY